jgi:LysR family glycine cleavage system transcriptional activator
LEAYFGKQLFVRNGNRITLTDAGRAIHPETSRALGDIAALTSRLLKDEPRTRLVVSVPFSIAEAWLAPKLVQLLETYPRIAIDIRVEEDPIDLARQNVDLRVSYGNYHYPALKSVELIHDEVLPMCSPEFWDKQAAARLGLEEIHQSNFIHTSWGPNYASHPTWSDWFSKAGMTRRPDPAAGRRVGLSSLAIAAARLGLGIALGQKTLAREDLETGRLIALSSASLPLGHAYCAFFAHEKADRAEVQSLIELLR